MKLNGRPTKHTVELEDEICARLAMGEPMTSIARDSHMPSAVTIYAWLRVYPDFLNRYAQSREDGAHSYAYQIAEIIDEEPLKVIDEHGNLRYDAGSIANKRLRMDGRKWLAAKYLPKAYGDKQILAGDAEAPLVMTGESPLMAAIKNIEMSLQARNADDDSK